MSFELTGKIHKIFPIERKSDKFQSRDFVIETHGKYPQFIKFQLVQDRCDALDPFNEGEVLQVFFDLRGREWEGKYFTNLNAWRIQKKVGSPDNIPAASQTMDPMPAGEEDEFPF